jgi:transcriptional regulator with XRE-family HTH domain
MLPVSGNATYQEEVPVTPAELVRSCRRGSGVTQQQLAVRAGTTKTAISRLERGHLSPSVGTLERLLLCLGYRLQAHATPLEPRIDPAQLDAVAPLTPDERLDHALASQASLASLLGAARGR